MDIAENVLNGSRLALSRAIIAVENEDDSAVGIMHQLHKHTGKAYIIGVTGPPEAGKSTSTRQACQILPPSRQDSGYYFNKSYKAHFPVGQSLATGSE